MTHAPVSLRGRRPLSPRQKRRLVLSFCTVLGAMPACSDRSRSSGQFLYPPSIDFLSAQNGEGTKFAPDEDALTLACDRNLTFEVGPKTNEVTLDNWSLRPKGYCSSNAIQCGYFRITFFDEDGRALIVRESANLFPVIQLDGVDPERIAGATITLIDGSSDEPWNEDDSLTKENESVPVEDTWRFTVSIEACENPPSMGGMGGMGGMSTVDPPLGGMGGGGMGGAVTGE